MIKIELNERELMVLRSLIDAGIKAIGIACVKDAAALIDRIDEAIKATSE